MKLITTAYIIFSLCILLKAESDEKTNDNEDGGLLTGIMDAIAGGDENGDDDDNDDKGDEENSQEDSSSEASNSNEDNDDPATTEESDNLDIIAGFLDLAVTEGDDDSDEANGSDDEGDEEDDEGTNTSNENTEQSESDDDNYAGDEEEQNWVMEIVSSVMINMFDKGDEEADNGNEDGSDGEENDDGEQKGIMDTVVKLVKGDDDDKCIFDTVVGKFILQNVVAGPSGTVAKFIVCHKLV